MPVGTLLGAWPDGTDSTGQLCSMLNWWVITQPNSGSAFWPLTVKVSSHGSCSAFTAAALLVGQMNRSWDASTGPSVWYMRCACAHGLCASSGPVSFCATSANLIA